MGEQVVEMGTGSEQVPVMGFSCDSNGPLGYKITHNMLNT
jgi:hypothetical protein